MPAEPPLSQLLAKYRTDVLLFNHGLSQRQQKDYQNAQARQIAFRYNSPGVESGAWQRMERSLSEEQFSQRHLLNADFDDILPRMAGDNEPDLWYNLRAFLERFILLDAENVGSPAMSHAEATLLQRVTSLEQRADAGHAHVASLAKLAHDTDEVLHNHLTHAPFLRDMQIQSAVGRLLDARMAKVEDQLLDASLLEQSVAALQAEQQKTSAMEQRLASVEARLAEQRAAERDEELKQAVARIAELEATVAKLQLAEAEPVVEAEE